MFVSSFRGKPFDYWAELEAWAEENGVAGAILENTKLRAKLKSRHRYVIALTVLDEAKEAGFWLDDVVDWVLDRLDNV